LKNRRGRLGPFEIQQQLKGKNVKITVTVEDSPEDFDPHNLLRNLSRDLMYGLARLSSVTLTGGELVIVGEPPNKADRDDQTDF
jgi:hypothetical protein